MKHPRRFYERLWKKKGCFFVAGIDEAGRGSWAGPLVSTCVVLPKGIKIKGVQDSKLLRAEKREQLFEILSRKIYFGVGVVTSEEIDNMGLSKSLQKSYTMAILELQRQLGKVPDAILLDGKHFYDLGFQGQAIIKGDQKELCIAAASIIAKVTRDRMMLKYARKFLRYGFERHKGYGTALHRKKIAEHGISQIHRKSVRPVAEFCALR